MFIKKKYSHLQNCLTFFINRVSDTGFHYNTLSEVSGSDDRDKIGLLTQNAVKWPT